MTWTSTILSHPVLLVGVGGAIGSIVRYGLGHWLGQLLPPLPIPIATTMINVIGSLILGYVAGMVEDRTQSAYLLLGIGFCGGFTTFSTLSLELVEQLQSGRIGLAILEGCLNIVLGISALVVGLWIAGGRVS